jgi:Zn-dependent membrane protease YugP
VTISYIWILIIGLVLGLATQAWVNSSYRKYSKVRFGTGQTGAQVARQMLDSSGLQHVRIERVGGHLSDHYDPRQDVLRLSESVHDGISVAAAGVASHEAGHAVQHARKFVFAGIRSRLVPAAQFGSQAAWPLLFIGFLTSMTGLITLGIVLFAAAVLFQVVTLPVEFDASRRAMSSIAETPSVTSEQAAGARRVLTAAAMTYLAAALVSILQLLYFVGLRD